MKQLGMFADETNDLLKQTSKEIADETAKIVKESAPVKSGKYKKAIAKKKESETLTDVTYIIYVRSPQYRLAHLLENGHLKRGGKDRVKAFPHFKLGDDYIRENFEKRFEEKLK